MWVYTSFRGRILSHGKTHPRSQSHVLLQILQIIISLCSGIMQYVTKEGCPSGWVRFSGVAPSGQAWFMTKWRILGAKIWGGENLPPVFKKIMCILAIRPSRPAPPSGYHSPLIIGPNLSQIRIVLTRHRHEHGKSKSGHSLHAELLLRLWVRQMWPNGEGVNSRTMTKGAGKLATPLIPVL